MSIEIYDPKYSFFVFCNMKLTYAENKIPTIFDNISYHVFSIDHTKFKMSSVWEKKYHSNISYKKVHIYAIVIRCKSRNFGSDNLQIVNISIPNIVCAIKSNNSVFISEIKDMYNE